MKKSLIILFLICISIQLQAQKSKTKYKTSDRVKIIQPDSNDVIIRDIETGKKKSSSGNLEYLHSLGGSFSYQFAPGSYYNFGSHISYQSRLTFLNSNDFLTLGLSLTNAIGFSYLTSNPSNISFNYQGLLGPSLCLGLESSTNSNDDFGFEIAPIMGMSFHSITTDKVSFGPGAYMAFKYYTWWDNPITLGFYYINDINSSHGGHLIGFRTAICLGDY